ncbi:MULTISPECIES: glycosyltransferase family 2 protein [unclassified Pseudomonas]|uniref:glycosyltransferase family 2 protein n=1 Tax=unclassified Pseudomonas TaxID=196821 RepID=UPI000BCBFDCF|nr:MULTISPECIES: glycosyl transferase [unclassified Pseudomonas]PVZ20270.1 GT2 family glycosyltransferase [Pseudomonas sp. URIL14HWK12:I12]PVZ27336.1 GT2 family glycosyltransferase [Pseudomonas sp. URIL14HWK12:I10]PVZ38225.1 GT2 family glycosyltransferase [Pseudomonas sp. URIL14HWK12:I11]SNZ04186.1 Glycosyltransferase, GT2 family [Pseudomonas sp. URIL14HWK12:I9]
MNVITLAHGREQALAHLIEGLDRQTLAPGALWVVHMNEAPREHKARHFPIYTRRVDSAEGLPLAAARNQALAIDPASAWAFLDVDCIPLQGWLAAYRQGLRQRPDALQLGQVRYLPRQAELAAWTGEALEKEAVAHPLAVHRPAPGGEVPYPLFWSLNFAVMGPVLEHIGGFDEGYQGYGAEDTDFAFNARERGVPLLACEALALHQYHAVWRPPLNHFAAIVANARRFRQRWGQWPMQDWLEAFAELELIRMDSETLEILRAPTPEQVLAARDDSGRGF